MSKRHRMNRSYSKKNFTRNALKVNKKNGLTGMGAPMRGGIRL